MPMSIVRYIKNRIRWSLAEFLEPEINGQITHRLLLFHRRLADDGHIKLPISRDPPSDLQQLAALSEGSHLPEERTKDHRPVDVVP